MDLKTQCNETVTIERQDGSRDEGVTALVTGKMIIIPDTTVPISAGDIVLRQIPSGLVDRLIVTDPGYHAKLHALSAHYQVKYRPAGQAPAGSPGYNVHVSGPNAHVNIQSTDNSIKQRTWASWPMNSLSFVMHCYHGQMMRSTTLLLEP